jgi:hypothetical protein
VKRRAHLMFVLLVAMLAFPVAANAMFPAGDPPDAPHVRHENASIAQVTAPPSTVSRITVTHESDNTLPIVLAAVSLGIALTGTAYLTVRVRSLSRTAPTLPHGH